MTPEEKAKELYLKFYTPFSESDTCFGYCDAENVTVCDHTGHGCGLWKKYAKQCTFIAVEEMIVIQNDFYGLVLTEKFRDRCRQKVEFLEQVKAAIEKL